MKTLTVNDKQNVLLATLLEGEAKHPQGYAIFGIEKEVVRPLIKLGYLHKDTYTHTGGAALTIIGRQIAQGKAGLAPTGRYEASIMKCPTGKYIFVGSVPLPLAFKDADMNKTRVYNTVKEAEDHARELRFTNYKTI